MTKRPVFSDPIPQGSNLWDYISRQLDTGLAAEWGKETIRMLIGQKQYEILIPEIDRRIELFGGDMQARLDAVNSVLDDVSANRYPRLESQVKGIMNVDK